jgi:hypothetical protein
VVAPCSSIAAAIEPIASLIRVMAVSMPNGSADLPVLCRIRKTFGADLFRSRVDNRRVFSSKR